jgi:NADPH-dependent 2,4-dienoyl-CoA reductase/sulfur reductase-like enzyme
MQVVVIGGSDAAVSAALRMRDLVPPVEPTLVLADDYPNYSVCGLPFYLSGEVKDWRTLAHRTDFDGIRLLRKHRVESIDPSSQTVAVVDGTGGRRSLGYDRLLIATGAVPRTSGLTGAELRGVFPLHTMDHGFAIDQHIREHGSRTAVIVGSGYIGLEMADALTRRGVRVTLLGRSSTPLPSVDPELGTRVGEELEAHGVTVLNSEMALGVEVSGKALAVCGGGFELLADVVLVAPGVRPASDLAAAAGVRLGVAGAIAVNRAMRTSVEDVFAAGDCAETWHHMLERNVYLPLGTTAHKQGRVAGENMLGGNRLFAGSVGTQVVKVFDLAIGRTGLRDEEARRAGFEPLTVETTAWDHKAYYPDAQKLGIRVTGDRRSGRLLGAQIIGHWRAQVAKRIDIFAGALFHGTRVEELNDLDLSYTPPLGSPWDPVQVAAQAWEARVRVEHRPARGAPTAD